MSTITPDKGRLRALVTAVTGKKANYQPVPVWTAKQVYRKAHWRYVPVESKGFAWTTTHLPKTAETRFRRWAAIRFRIRKRNARRGDPWTRFTPYGTPVFCATRKTAEKKAKEWAAKAAKKGKE